jgi:hypothetical protein
VVGHAGARLFGPVASDPTAWRLLSNLDSRLLDRLAQARAARGSIMSTGRTRAHAIVSPTGAIADTKPQTAEGKVGWAELVLQMGEGVTAQPRPTRRPAAPA